VNLVIKLLAGDETDTFDSDRPVGLDLEPLAGAGPTAAIANNNEEQVLENDVLLEE
jgi:hypothetical protein